MKYATRYTQGGMQYGSHIYADTWSDAVEIAKKRNIGETVIGQAKDTKDSVTPEGASPIQLLHETVFLSFILLKMEAMTIEEILGDQGILHEIAHYLHLKGEPLNRDLPYLKDKVQEMRAKVPGYAVILR